MSKFTVFLAGDSTVQSYRKELTPIAGWGQLFHLCFQPGAAAKKKDVQEEGFTGDWMGYGSASDSAFAQSILYDKGDFCIDNRAMAGRSSRSFVNEGRLEDLEKAIQADDFLFMQFAHNDANKEKEERYVTTEQYEEYLLRYVNAAKSRGAEPVLVTAIAMRNCGDSPDGRFTYSFPEYRETMLEMGEKYGLIVLDLGKATTDYLNTLEDPEESKKLYLWVEAGLYPGGPYAEGHEDNAHLQRKGAEIFAGLLAGLIREYDKDERLDALKCRLAD